MGADSVEPTGPDVEPPGTLFQDSEYECRHCGYVIVVFGGVLDGTSTCPNCQEYGASRSRPTLDDYDNREKS